MVGCNNDNGADLRRSRESDGLAVVQPPTAQIFLAKADCMWLAYGLLAVFVACLAFQAGVHAEKIGQLEDIVFNYRVVKGK